MMGKRISLLVLVSAAIALNVGIGSIVHLLKLPIYLDSIGIMVAALIIPGARCQAFCWAAIVGVISFILGGLLVNPFLPWFSLTAIAGAAYGSFVVRGRLDASPSNPASRGLVKLILFGIGWGVLAAVVSAPIVVYLFGGVTASGTTLITAFLIKTGEQLFNAVLLTGLAAEPVDKALQLLIALLVVRATPKAFLDRM